jgi:hypothetical protein
MIKNNLRPFILLWLVAYIPFYVMYRRDNYEYEWVLVYPSIFAPVVKTLIYSAISLWMVMKNKWWMPFFFLVYMVLYIWIGREMFWNYCNSQGSTWLPIEVIVGYWDWEFLIFLIGSLVFQFLIFKYLVK